MPFKDPVQQRAYQVAWLQQRRLAWLAENGPCADCGTWDDLEIDHRDPAQKISHRIWAWARTRREAELAKCQVLCYRCHQIKTNAQGRTKRFCSQGHDTWECGRDKQYRCRRCRAEREYPVTNARKRRARRPLAPTVRASA